MIAPTRPMTPFTPSTMLVVAAARSRVASEVTRATRSPAGRDERSVIRRRSSRSTNRDRARSTTRSAVRPSSTPWAAPRAAPSAMSTSSSTTGPRAAPPSAVTTSRTRWAASGWTRATPVAPRPSTIPPSSAQRCGRTYGARSRIRARGVRASRSGAGAIPPGVARPRRSAGRSLPGLHRPTERLGVRSAHGVRRHHRGALHDRRARPVRGARRLGVPRAPGRRRGRRRSAAASPAARRRRQAVAASLAGISPPTRTTSRIERIPTRAASSNTTTCRTPCRTISPPAFAIGQSGPAVTSALVM